MCWRVLELTSHVDGTMIVPPEFIEAIDKKIEPNPAYSPWKKEEITILSWINPTVSKHPPDDDINLTKNSVQSLDRDRHVFF